jgi:type II secretory pathway component PulF
MHVSPRRGRPLVPVGDAVLAVAYQQMAALLGAGIAVREVLRLLVRRTRGRLREALVATAAGVDAGATLSDAMAADPAVFPETVRSFVVAGEASGDLPGVFAELAASVEVRLDIRRRIVRACVYPFILYTLSFFMLPFDKLVTDGLGAYLAAAAVPYALVTAAIAAVVALVPRILGRVRRRLPVVGPLYVVRARMVFARHLAAALRAGMDAFRSLSLAARATGDAELEARIAEAAGHVRAGTSLEEALDRTGQFDDVFLLAVAGGEASGHLTEALDQQARLLKDQLIHRLDVLVQIAAVAVLLAIYAFVGARVYFEFKRILGGGGDVDQLMKELDLGGGATLPPELLR